MHAQALAWLQVVGQDLAAQLAPCPTLAGDLLEREAVAAEEAGAEALLKPDRELHATEAADKGVPVAEVAHSRLGRDVDREDRPGKARREGDHAGGALRGELAHEDRAPTDGRLEDPADTAAAAHLRRRLHDDRPRHPGEFSGLGEDGLARVEHDLEHGHGGAEDAVLHGVSSEGASVSRSLCVVWPLLPMRGSSQAYTTTRRHNPRAVRAHRRTRFPACCSEPRGTRVAQGAHRAPRIARLRDHEEAP